MSSPLRRVRESAPADVAAAYQSTLHPDYSILAARVAVSNLHKSTPARFSECARQLFAHVHPKTGERAPLISDEVMRVVEAHHEAIDAAVKDERDFEYDYFGFKTLERSYLLRVDGAVAERP
jgi:ribonucleotide reductase alpha subunit